MSPFWKLSVLSFAFLAILAAGDPPEVLSGSSLPAGQGFRLYSQIKRKAEHGGPQFVDFGYLNNESQMRALFDDIGPTNVSSLFPGNDSTDEEGDDTVAQVEVVEVIIIVPKGAPARYIQEFREMAERSMSHLRNASIQYKMVESYVDLKADFRAMEQLRQQLNAIAVTLPANSIELELARLADEQIEAGLNENETFCRSWHGGKPAPECNNERTVARGSWFMPSWLKWLGRQALNVVSIPHRAVDQFTEAMHPGSVIIMKQFMAATKFSISFTVAMTRYGWNLWSFPTSFVSGMVGALFGFNALAWSKLAVKKFPWLPRNLMVRLYNGLPDEGRSFCVNFARSYFLHFFLRGLAFYAGLTVMDHVLGTRVVVGTPWSWKFALSGVGITFMEVLTDGALDGGRHNGMGRRRFNSVGANMKLWLCSLFDTTMHILFRTEAEVAAWVMAANSWQAKTSMWYAGRFGDAPTTRYYLVSQAIGNVPSAPADVISPEFEDYQPPAPVEATPRGRLAAAANWTGNKVVRGLKIVKNFARYLSGWDALSKIRNWRKFGRHDQSDEELVNLAHGLSGQLWSLQLQPDTVGDLSDAERILVNELRKRHPEAPIKQLFQFERLNIGNHRQARFQHDPTLSIAEVKKWLKVDGGDKAGDALLAAILEDRRASGVGRYPTSTEGQRMEIAYGVYQRLSMADQKKMANVAAPHVTTLLPQATSLLQAIGHHEGECFTFATRSVTILASIVQQIQEGALPTAESLRAAYPAFSEGAAGIVIAAVKEAAISYSRRPAQPTVFNSTSLCLRAIAREQEELQLAAAAQAAGPEPVSDSSANDNP